VTDEGRELPPDPDDQNDDRANWARCAVRAFASQTGQLKRPDGGRIDRGTEERLNNQLAEAGQVEDMDEAVGDLLCDLMHLTDREGLDFTLLLERAIGNYAAETEEVGG
jgi:hypothetical protein